MGSWLVFLLSKIMVGGMAQPQGATAPYGVLPSITVYLPTSCSASLCSSKTEDNGTLQAWCDD